MSTDQEVDELIKLLSNVTDAHTSALFWLNEEQNRLQLKAAHSLGHNLCTDTSIDMGCGLLGRVADNAKPIQFSDFDQHPRTLQYYATKEDIKSFVAVPILHKDKLLGVLSIDSKRDYLFTDKHQKILNGFARQFANMLERQRRAGESEGQLKGGEKLYKLCQQVATADEHTIFSALLNISREMLAFDDCVLALLNDAQDKLQLKLAHGDSRKYTDKWFPADQGLAGLVLKQKKSLRLIKLSQGENKWTVFGRRGPKLKMNSFLGLPLLCAGRVNGVLVFASRKPEAFSLQDEKLTAVLALQIAAITAQWQLQKAKESSRQLDGVTGLLNHSAFQQQLEEQLASATPAQPLCLLLISVDKLAGINQDFGYEIGDEILQQVARILMEVAPVEENVARFGGQKFALILPHTTSKAAKELAKRICNIVERSRFRVGRKELTIMVSIASVSSPTDIDDGDSNDRTQLVDYAKKALRLAMQAKENNVCPANDLLTGVSIK